MSRDDPFFSEDDSDRTVIRPMPGGRRATGAPPPSAKQRAPVEPIPPSARAVQAGSGLNPLVHCASALLVVAAQLRNSAAHPDPDGLRNKLIEQVRAFESCAREKGIADATVLPARYVLCSLLDEAVLGTPWGSESIWANRGLLISFHNEAWGGEKFFLALERLIAYPSGNLHMLELMYLCLALGFEGRYRVRDGGGEQLEMVRERLYQTIRAQRGDPEPELSPNWQGVVERRDPLLYTLPIWVLTSIAVALLLVLFSLFSFLLNRESDPVFDRVAALEVDPIVVEPSPPEPRIEPPAAARPRLTLRILLAEEIKEQKLDVIGDPKDRDGEMIRIMGDGLFASGRADLKPEYLPVLDRIADALSQLPGRIEISGHTDNVPMRWTRRFSGNQALSEARAESVRAELERTLSDPERIRTKGKGASDLLIQDPGSDPRNRRVEITLSPGRNANGAPQ